MNCRRQFIPAAALASGAEGSFYQTDVDLNNAGGQVTEYEFLWLPRGETNTDPVTSEPFSLGAGMSVRYANVLSEVFGLEPNSLGRDSAAVLEPGSAGHEPDLQQPGADSRAPSARRFLRSHRATSSRRVNGGGFSLPARTKICASTWAVRAAAAKGP